MSEKSANLEATGKPTPAAGCTIFFVIFGMIAFLVTIFLWQGGEYDEVIQTISEEEAKPTQIADTSDSKQIEALENKIASFAQDVKGKKASTLELSKDDINLMIAHYPKLESLKGTLAVSEIADDHIKADLCFAVRAKASMLDFAMSLFSEESEGDMRYLNGTMEIQPVIAQGSIFPKITDISPDTGNPVPPKMIREFPTFLFTEYRNDQDLADVFHKLTKVTLSNGKMIITSDPAAPIEGENTENMEEAEDRATSFFLLLVFMFVTTVTFILWVKKRKQNASE